MGADGAEIDAELFDSSDTVDDVKTLVKFDRNEGSVCFGCSSLSLGASLAFVSSSASAVSGAGGGGSTVGSGIGLQKLSVY